MNLINMRKFWLLFAQSTTVALGVLFIIALFKPDLLRWQPQPQNLTIKAGVPVRWKVDGTEAYGCTSIMTIPATIALTCIVFGIVGQLRFGRIVAR